MARQIEWNGKQQSIREWAIETGIAVGTLEDRLRKGWDVERALTTIPDTYANKQAGGGRQLKDGIVSSYLDVWNKCGKKEFESQLVVAFKTDALKVVKDFQQYLPREVADKPESKTEKAVVRIELMTPEHLPPMITLEKYE